MGGHDLVRRMDKQGEVLTWRKKCFERGEAKKRTEANELLKTGTDGHQRKNSRGRKSHSQRDEELEN